MTYRQFLNAVIEANFDADITFMAKQFLEKEEERILKRKESSANKKNTEDAPIIASILEYLNGTEKATASEISALINQSTAKVASVCKNLANNGDITIVKGKSANGKYSVNYYTICK